MGQIETEGIILKTYSLAEADKIVLMLTEKFGLIRGVAKGAKRLKSKFGGILEPFSVVLADLYQKEERELVSIRGLELQKSYFTQASNPLILQKLAYLSELLIEFSPPHDPNVRVYKMAKVCFDAIIENPERIELVVFYFELWILSLGGYLPGWEKCDICANSFDNLESYNLQMNFHLVCNNCQRSKNNRIVTPVMRQIYYTAQNSSPRKFIELFSENLESIKNLSEILKKLINQILNREIVSQKFLVSSQS
ncbi:MAG: DNA repair protein RecO [Pyrinomonadaceae bacterium]